MIKEEECFGCSLYWIKDVTRELYLFFAGAQKNPPDELAEFS